MTTPSLSKKFPWLDANFIILSLIITFYIFIQSPPELALDSATMYNDAVNLNFKDYWPPLTLLLWHYLDKIYPGGLLMLFLNLSFLWGACLIGFYCFKGKRISYWFIFIPFFPVLFAHANEILKDNIISFGYMFLAMYLAKLTLMDERITWIKALLVLVGIFYFSMAKIQAQFFFPFMTLWLVMLLPPIKPHKPLNIIAKSLIFITITAGVFFGMKECNRIMIQDKNNAHFWQFVKIYDLAGMSVYGKKNYIPPFLFKTPTVTLQDIEDHYAYLWEPLIRNEDSPLVETKNDEERLLLVEAWKSAIIKDPISYLKHRSRIMIKMLTNSGLKGLYQSYFSNNQTMLLFSPLFSLFRLMVFMPFYLYFWFLGARYFCQQKSAIPLFMLSSMGLTLIMVLFVFSLAAASRYVFFSWCCLLFSLPFAWDVYWKTRRI
ncbi:MAG: hypothetical protein KBB83_01545 [Alphaproteobacteria bacterium]|nr:hypothetical protein [Alphaproteobacteria bacterium]